jgi:predicted MFS family arabinose efflux permease
MLSAPPLLGPASSLHDAAVGTGVGSLSGWGAAVLVIAVLGLFAWWTSRSSSRRRSREATRPRERRPALDLRDRTHLAPRRRD